MADMEYKNGSLCVNKIDVSTSLNLSDDAMTEFQQALKDSGFHPGGSGDWSDYLSNDGDNPLYIPEPRCAKLNIISDFNLSNLNKAGRSGGIEGVNYNIPTQVEFYDMQGNYFKKWTLMSGQGASSMSYPKKNIALDFFDSEVDGDAFNVKFGEWVPQDSFHLKAYYTDAFRGVSVIAYKIADQVEKTYGMFYDRPWKKELLKKYTIGTDTMNGDPIEDISLSFDTGALNHPDAFPVIVYQNGEFYGIYSWCIKKHRDNYHMKKSNPKHIHLDGNINATNVFGGSINWTQFEIRNPKNLVYAHAKTFYNSSTGAEEGSTYKYDADLYKPGVSDYGQDEIAGNSDGSSTYDDWEEGSYTVDKIVKYDGHYYINTIEDNTATPIYNKKNNGDDAPDFKNKTGCGWINCTNTIKVKNAIISLSKRMAEIKDPSRMVVSTPAGNVTIGSCVGIYDASINYSKGQWVKDNENNCFLSIKYNNIGNSLSDTNSWADINTNISSIETEIEKYFDKPTLIDFLLIQLVLADSDSFGKNTQWTCYDGIKWYTNEYDKDMCFGGNFLGTFIMPPFMSWVNDGHMYTGGWPIEFVRSIWLIELMERYGVLRKSIFTTDNIMKVFNEYVNRIGEDNYDKEFNIKWVNCVCHRERIMNEGWEIDSFSSFDEYANIANYSSETTYQNGDRCKHNFMVCKCTSESPLIGVEPIVQTGHYDNVYRVKNWTDARLQFIDECLNYTEN